VQFDVNLIILSSDLGCKSPFFGEGFFVVRVIWTDNDLFDKQLHQFLLVFQREQANEALEILQTSLDDIHVYHMLTPPVDLDAEFLQLSFDPLLLIIKCQALLLEVFRHAVLTLEDVHESPDFVGDSSQLLAIAVSLLVQRPKRSFSLQVGLANTLFQDSGLLAQA